MRYQNNQLWSECQLVALWNAARFHVKLTPKMGSRLYKKICKESRCIYGGCIDIDKETKRLGFKVVPGRFNFKWIERNLPVHFTLFTHKGYHSVLAVGSRDKQLLLANYATGRLHWMGWKKLLTKKRRVFPISYVLT